MCLWLRLSVKPHTRTVIIHLQPDVPGPAALQTVNREEALLRCVRELPEATIIFIMSVCSSVSIEQLGCHQKGFYEIR